MALRSAGRVSVMPVVALWLGIAMALVACEREAPPPPPQVEEAPLPVTGDEAPVPPPAPGPSDVITSDEDLHAEAVEEEPMSPNVKLRLEINPKSAPAFVFWGRKRLGKAPLQFEHPRNSGPMDIVIKAEGFLDYHTRLFTDRNDRLVVNLVRPREANTLLGYKHTPDAGAPVVTPDGGLRPSPRDAGVRPPAPEAGTAFTVPPSVQF